MGALFGQRLVMKHHGVKVVLFLLPPIETLHSEKSKPMFDFDSNQDLENL